MRCSDESIHTPAATTATTKTNRNATRMRPQRRLRRGFFDFGGPGGGGVCCRTGTGRRGGLTAAGGETGGRRGGGRRGGVGGFGGHTGEGREVGSRADNLA